MMAYLSLAKGVGQVNGIGEKHFGKLEADRKLEADGKLEADRKLEADGSVWERGRGAICL